MEGELLSHTSGRLKDKIQFTIGAQLNELPVSTVQAEEEKALYKISSTSPPT